MDSEDREELNGSIAEMLVSEGWQCAKRSLRRRQGSLSRHLAMGTKKTLEEVRELQIRYMIIEELLNDPRKFFRFEES